MKICAQNGYGLEPHFMCGYFILFHFLLFSDVETGRPLTPSLAYTVSGKAAGKVSTPRSRYMTRADVEGSRLLGYRCTDPTDWGKCPMATLDTNLESPTEVESPTDPTVPWWSLLGL